MSEVLIRNIQCKSCNIEFKYKYTLDHNKGGFRGITTKKYCDECVKIRKQINKRESQRIYIERAFKKIDNPSITKKIVIHNAIKFILDLNKYMKTNNTSSDIYDKVINILPDGYITRDALRRQYRELTVKNEI